MTITERLDGIEAFMGKIRTIDNKDGYKVSLTGKPGERKFSLSYCGAILAKFDEAKSLDYRCNPAILLTELRKAMATVQPTAELRALAEKGIIKAPDMTPEATPLKERVQWAPMKQKLVPDKDGEDPFGSGR